MPLATIIQLMTQFGIPMAETLWKKWNDGTPATQADFDQWRALAAQQASDRMKLALSQAGIALDNPKAAALLALTQ